MNSKQSLKLVVKLIHVDVSHLEKEAAKISSQHNFQSIQAVPANLLKSPIHKIKVLQKSHSVNTVIHIAKILF